MDKYSIYIHIPFCKARCGYCAFSSNTDYSLQEAYFAKLYDEITFFSDKTKPIYTIYLGGGTPSSVETKYLDRLFTSLNQHFDLSHVEEITVECNPESVTDVLLDTLKRNGVNRISMGLQSVNDATLKRIGRLHSYADFLNALQLACSHGFDNINADLIVGLPESAEDFVRSINTVVALHLQHISVYALELHEETALYSQLNGETFLSDDQLADLYDEACGIFASNGLKRYEISNFAQSGKQCKHNLNYWQEGRYFAFGASASGFVGDFRYVNPYSICDYLLTPTDCLHLSGDHISRFDQANEYVMLGLRLSSGVLLAEFNKRYETDFWKFFPKAAQLQDDGFLRVDGDRVTVPDDKLYVVNSILCELLTL